MAFKINGVTVVNNDREVTVNSVTASANDRFYVGVTATNSPTSVLSPSIFQGSVSGYTSGGAPTSTVIDKFPFSSDSNATDVGDLTVGRYNASGQSSTTHGYFSGGRNPVSLFFAIDKFPFSVDTNAVGVGNLNIVPGYTAGRYQLSDGNSSETHGYASGGLYYTNAIEKFTFSADSNSTDVGNLTQGRMQSASQSSSTHGYNSGGNSAPTTRVNTIDKFPFSTDTNATDVGDLFESRTGPSGSSSTTHGYSSGGILNPPPASNTNTIDKFPFASDTNATDVGDLSSTIWGSGGQSSTTDGYNSGGNASGPTISNVIDKFPFSSDTNATDIGDLTQARFLVSSQQARTIQ